jgi:hypothetical protein
MHLYAPHAKPISFKSSPQAKNGSDIFACASEDKKSVVIARLG